MPQTAVESDEKDGGSARLLTTLCCMALGLVMPHANIYGVMAPFGISMVAAVDGTGSILVYTAAMVGYLLAGGTGTPMRYLVAVAVTGAVRWTFSVLPSVARKRWFPSLLSFTAALVSGLLMGGAGTFTAVLLTVAEALAAGVFAYFFGEAFSFLTGNRQRTTLTVTEQTGFILMGATLVMAFAPLTLYYISPARILAGICIMLFARSGREQSGAVAGLVLGTAMALSVPERPYLALALGFGGLLAGVFSRYGRFAIAGMYLIGNVLLCLADVADLQTAAAIYEATASGLIFVVLPRRIDKVLRRFLVSGQQLPAVEGLRRSMSLRLDVAANAMQEVAGTVDTVSRKLSRYGAPDLGSMYRYVGDTICKHCNLRMYCWEHHFSAVMDAFNQLTPILREREMVTKEDMGGFLAKNCRRQSEVAAQICEGYRLYLQRENGWQRLAEIRAVLSDQFAGMGDVLAELGERFSRDRRVDVETAGRVVALCEDFGMPVLEAVCLLDTHGRMTVELLAEDVGVCTDGGRWFREMEVCCGREFDKPSVLEMHGTVKVTLTERPVFVTEIGVAQRTASGEKLSGDVCERYVDGGKSTCILSDGMGSGGRAAVDGAMAAGITARLLRAGLGPDTVLKMVNTALIAKSGDESLTTLDVAQIDLFDGSMKVHKAGAASSLLKSGGRISRIEAPSLPIGILQDAEFAHHTDALADGDTVLMMSDGMLFDGVAWIEEYLRDHDQTAAALAQGILDAAVLRQEDQTHTDDMTVAVICLKKRN